MKNKKILALILALVMLLCLVGCSQKPADEDQNETTTAPVSESTDGNQEQTGKYAITVKIVHKDGSEKVLSYRTDKEFLGELLLEKKVIQGSDGPYGLEISHVDGEQAIYNKDKAYWALYEGDQYAMQGISTTPIVDGGEYALVYTPA